MSMRVVDDQIEGYIEMQPDLVGNVAFKFCMVVLLRHYWIVLVAWLQWNNFIAVQPRRFT